jgi:hypothetical protein
MPKALATLAGQALRKILDHLKDNADTTVSRRLHTYDDVWPAEVLQANLQNRCARPSAEVGLFQKLTAPHALRMMSSRSATSSISSGSACG